MYTDLTSTHAASEEGPDVRRGTPAGDRRPASPSAGRLSVTELAEKYDVTTETVRRDLSTLERAGLVRRVHGGAVPATSLTVLETAVSDRDRAQRRREGPHRAAALAPPAPTGGSRRCSTPAPPPPGWPGCSPVDRRLDVFTHAVPIAARLAGRPSVELHLLPGRVRPTTQAAVGEDTVAALSAAARRRRLRRHQRHLARATACRTPDHERGRGQAGDRGAARTGWSCSPTPRKLGEEHLVRFADLDEVDVLVTDERRSTDADRAALDRRAPASRSWIA